MELLEFKEKTMERIQVELLDIWVILILIIAPEVLLHLNHTFVADYYAIGILTYELMTG